MHPPNEPSTAPVVRNHLAPGQACLLGGGAVGAFHLAQAHPGLSWLVLGYLGGLFELRKLPSARQAFYVGMLVGFGVFVPQTWFLWTIFHAAALPLWGILALFPAAFLTTLNRTEARWGPAWSVGMAPVLWCGIEYFRSEVWWLRFSWLTAGSLPGSHAGELLRVLGIYGLGAVTMALVAIYLGLPLPRPAYRRWVIGSAVILLGAGWLWPASAPDAPETKSPAVEIGGIQMEFPGVPEVVAALDDLIRTHPQVELIVLSEYTFDGPIPTTVKQWCRRKQRWLIAGGKQPIVADTETPTREARRLETSLGPDTERYFNTAFVVSTNGDVVFSQAKSRPIQFFKDGEPAREQQLWASPWGRIGIAICYDVSYRQVMDRLVRLGAQAMIVPTMDVVEWGEREHRLNARMATIRATEYGLPLFRVASSGISQLVGGNGREQAVAGFPGPNATITGTFQPVPRGGQVPLDAWLAPACMYGSGGGIVGLAASAWLRRRQRLSS